MTTSSPDDRALLITGAGGQLGAALLAACASRGVRAVGLTRSELDIADPAQILRVLNELEPRAIINCAAYTDVDGAESDRDAAFLVNETGPRNLAAAALAREIHLVHVSTDYVFPGTAPDGYAEHDETGPINVYGESKLAGELAIREAMGADGAWTIARSAWLFSNQPPNFVLTIAGLAADRQTLDVVDDQRGNPTWCGHLADALVTCVLDDVRGVRHLVDTPEATWKDLASSVVETTGAACEVRPTTSDAYPRPAKRAAVSVLRVTEPGTPPMGDWRDGVRASLRSTATIG